MKVLFDTNIILDVLLERNPFCQPASQLFSYVESGTLAGFLCATTLTTVYSLAAKTRSRREAQEDMGKLLQLFDIAPVNRLVLEAALEVETSDFEDAVLAASAHHAGMDCLVTRNPRDFRKSPLSIHSPDELLQIMSDTGT